MEEFCIFCDTTYKAVICHVSTRWLSLEKVVSHVLQLYDSLVSYLKSTDEQQARFSCLRKQFPVFLMEIHLLFLQSVFPLFTHFNLLLECEDP